MAQNKFSKSLIIVSIIIVLILTSGYIITKGVSEDVKQAIMSRELLHLENIKDKINSEFTKFDAVAFSIANSPRIIEFAIYRTDKSFVEANEAINRYNLAFNSSVTYILDTNGIVLATTNRFSKDSFLGKNYNFRDYFKQAMNGKQGEQISIGLTSNTRGYYTCYPIKNKKSVIIGAVAVKIELDLLEKQLKLPNIFLVDPNGIIFLSSNTSLQFKFIGKITQPKLDSLKNINIYRMKSYDYLWEKYPNNEETVDYDGSSYIFMSKLVNSDNWTIAILVETDKISSTFTVGLLIATIICFIIIAIYRVIDNYFQAHKKIKQREEELNHLLDFLPDGAFAINNQKEVIAWNREFENLSGIKSEFMIGKNNYEYSIPFYGIRRPLLIDLINESIDVIKTHYPTILIEDKTLIAETNIILPNGENAIVLAKAGNVYNANGDIIGAIEVVRDITKIKKYENEIVDLLEKLTEANSSLEENINQKDYLIMELNTANSELSRLNAEKDKFFSIVSHDLRSPLSGFLSLSQMIIEENQKLSKSQIIEYVNILHSSSNLLYELLENLLEWARIQLGTAQYKPKNINIRDIIQDNINLLSIKANSKSISFYNMVDIKTEISSDPNMLNAIIRNLFSNAVKFTNKNGSIFIRSSINEQGCLILKIQDTGIGMSEALIGKLFDLGQNTSRLGTDGEASSGLGLVLCKEYSQRINANLVIESEVAKGSAFILEFNSKIKE